jgi:hypothetical protein
MTPEETKKHLEDVHGVHVSDDSIADLEVADWEELHQIDHDEWLADQHMHDDDEAHRRIWCDPDVKLERVDDE